MPAVRAAESPLLLVLESTGRVAMAEGDGWELLGLRARGLMGRDASEVLQAWPVLQQRAVQALAGQAGSAIICLPEGQLRLELWPRLTDDGKPHGAVITGRFEPPERRIGDPRNRHTVPFLRLLFRQVPGAVWTTDATLRLTFVVGRLLELPGGALRARTGDALIKLLGTDDPDNPVMQAHHAALRGEFRCFSTEFGGRYYDIQVRPLRDRSGALIGCVGQGLDVTEFRQLELEREESRIRLDESQRLAHVGSWRWDVDRDRVVWSPELHRVYGLEPGGVEMTFEEFLGRVHPEDAAKARTTILKAFEARAPFDYDHRIVRPDGSVRMLHTRGDVVTDAHGRVTRMGGSSWDVTRLCETDAELHRSVSLLKATLDSTADGLLVVDLAGRILSYNQRFLELWGIPPELARSGRDAALLEYVVSQLDDPEHFRSGVERLYRDLETVQLDVLTFRDGRVFERYSRPQRIDGHVVGRVWSFRDVSEREFLLERTLMLADTGRLLFSLGAEAALPGLAQVAVRSLTDACAIDLETPEGPQRRAEAFRVPRARGLLPPPGSGRPEHLPPEQDLIAVLEVEGGQLFGIPLRFREESLGTMLFGILAPRCFSEADQWLLREVAHRLSLSVATARGYRRVEEAVQARDELLGIAAHEIRGPVTSIHLAVQQLKNPELPAATKRSLQALIEREDLRLSRFVEELLDVEHVRSGQLRLRREPVDLVALTQDVVSRLRADARKAGCEISILSPESLIGPWDAARLEQVLFHLLTNALKFGRGSPIEVNMAAVDGLALLHVTDHGLGIRPELQDHIFDPFVRAVSARHYGGLGLGLFIARTIVEGLGGTITVRSEPGQGASFQLTLPLEATQ